MEDIGIAVLVALSMVGLVAAFVLLFAAIAQAIAKSEPARLTQRRDDIPSQASVIAATYVAGVERRIAERNGKDPDRAAEEAFNRVIGKGN